MNYLNRSTLIFSLLAITAIFAIASESFGDAKTLDPAAEGVKKLEVTQSQIGYRNTLIFYTFGEQKAVLRVSIDNKTKDFPIAATVYSFADDVTAEGIGKWLNNQHSDGLYPEVPEPTATIAVPADSFKIVSQKSVGQEKPFFGTYDKYAVEFELKETQKLDGVNVEAFKESTNVYIKLSDEIPKE